MTRPSKSGSDCYGGIYENRRLAMTESGYDVSDGLVVHRFDLVCRLSNLGFDKRCYPICHCEAAVSRRGNPFSVCVCTSSAWENKGKRRGKQIAEGNEREKEKSDVDMVDFFRIMCYHDYN